jgi:hypothetical protein
MRRTVSNFTCQPSTATGKGKKNLRQAVVNIVPRSEIDIKNPDLRSLWWILFVINFKHFQITQSESLFLQFYLPDWEPSFHLFWPGH